MFVFWSVFLPLLDFIGITLQEFYSELVITKVKDTQNEKTRIFLRVQNYPV